MKYPLMTNNIKNSDLNLLVEFLKQGESVRLTNGPKVVEFEEEWSRWLGVKYSVFVSSGSASNFISLQLLKRLYPKGGEVILPAFTWVSDVAAVIHHGFTPIFCDIRFHNLCLDPYEIERKITDKTVAVFLTYAQGFNGLSTHLLETLADQDILLLEDVCESHGARFDGKKLGTFGWVSNFSFYFAHHMSTIEGGMISTNDEETYQYARMFRSHGMLREATSDSLKQNVLEAHRDLNEEFVFVDSCFNFRSTELNAILGLSQLARLDSNIESRNKNFNIFISSLCDKTFFTDFDLVGMSNYAFQVILKNPDIVAFKELTVRLDNAGIEYRRGSAGGGNQLRQPYLRDHLSHSPESLENTDFIHHYCLYVGNSPELTETDIKYITSVINGN